MQLCATHPRRSCLGLVEAARPRPGLATFNAVHPRRPHRRRWRCFDPLTGPRSEGPGLPQPLFTAEARLGRVRPDFLPNRHRSQLDRRQALQASGRGRTVRCNAFDELKTFLFKMSEKRVNRMSCLHVIYPSLGACPGFDEPNPVLCRSRCPLRNDRTCRMVAHPGMRLSKRSPRQRRPDAVRFPAPGQRRWSAVRHLRCLLSRSIAPRECRSWEPFSPHSASSTAQRSGPTAGYGARSR